MEITQWYAIVVASAASSFLLLNLFAYLALFRGHISLIVSKHLTFPYVLSRHALLGPWSAADVLLQMVYLTVNVFFLSFRVTDMSQAGVRAGTLSLINMAPLFGGLHHDFLADLFGSSLKTCQRVHRSAGFAAFACAALHVIIAAMSKSPVLRTLSLHPFLIIVRALRLHHGFQTDFFRQV